MQKKKQIKAISKTTFELFKTAEKIYLNLEFWIFSFTKISETAKDISKTQEVELEVF